MSDAVITVILTQAVTILDQQIRREVRLVSGVGKGVRKLKSEFESIRAVLRDAEKRQVKEESVKLWLERLKDVSYDTEDVLSEWITAMRKAEVDDQSSSQKVRSCIALPFRGCNRVALRRDIAIKIKKINERLASIATEKDRYKFEISTGNEYVDRPRTDSFVELSEVRGRESDKNTLIRQLLYPKNPGSDLNIVSIVGLGGIGKTTLAQAVYNSSDVIHNFDMRMWVCVSEPFDEVRIAKAILEEAEGSAPHLFELQPVAKRIRSCIQGKKFMLVFDDVWTEDYRRWEQLLKSLRKGAPGSTILVTTRNENAAKVMGSRYDLPLGELSSIDSWELFKEIAFHDSNGAEYERLEGVGREISTKCKGLPLTVKTIASLMRVKNGLKEWQDVLESEFWELKEADKLFPPLMLSYYDLHPFVRLCFSFCAVFPKDHIIKADNLIKLWMAQGYLISTENVEMELIGQAYLQDLVQRSFFQNSEKGKDGKRVVSVKMHDMVHDFAQYLTKNECSVIEANCDLDHKFGSSLAKVRHLTLIRSEDAPLPNVPNVDRVATFWVQSFYDSPPIVTEHDRVKAEFFDRLARLRALDLSRNRIGELAKEIGNLVELKYLNLSHNPVRELPENLCDLSNLQTLNLSVCDHLRKLPQGIGKLVNLRHLEIEGTDSLNMLPKGIGKLGSLQTLSKFIVARTKDPGGEAACELGDLSKLNNLRGYLKIEGLGFVKDGNEAKRAELHRKSHLTDLHLDFGPAIQSVWQDEVIEALQLHENVQSLQISSYTGTKLPKWIMTLPNMQKLFLQDCKNCTHMPPLGRLPSLMTLHLEGMNSLKVLGLEFLGICANVNSTMNGEGGSGGNTAFPKLKKLKISKMESWEEWNVTSNERGMDEKFDVMPRLRCLKVLDCPKLKALPELLLERKTIKKRRIRGCPCCTTTLN